jgi:hypothetical protein
VIEALKNTKALKCVIVAEERKFGGFAIVFAVWASAVKVYHRLDN